MKVLASSLDDLWTIYNIILPGDLVYARTTRELKIEGIGRPSSRRLSVFMGLRVAKTYFDREMSKLRILGTVVEAPEEVHAQGTHHTITLGPDDQAIIIKDRWQHHELERLQKSTIRQEPLIIVALDSEECAIGHLRSYGVEVRSEIRSRLPGKLESEKREEAMKQYFSEISKSTKIIQEETRARILIVGPGFVRDNLAKYLRSADSETASAIAGVKGVSHGGLAGVYESIRSGVVSKIMRDARVVEEAKLVEEVLKRLGASTGDVAYGIDEVERDAAQGAVETLLVCDGALREATDDGRKRIDEVIRSAEAKRGKFAFISSQHEAGKKLMSLGGIAALLRYAKHLGTS